MGVLVTATNPDGTAVATSTATSTVQAAAPVNTTRPALTGAAQRGVTLASTQGAWSGIGNSYAYQWQHSANGSTPTNIGGASALELYARGRR